MFPMISLSLSYNIINIHEHANYMFCISGHWLKETMYKLYLELSYAVYDN